MEQPSFKEILESWLIHIGHRMPREKTERLEAFVLLIGNLNKHGYTKETLTRQRILEITERLVNPNHPNKSKLKAWMRIIAEDWNQAFYTYYKPVEMDENVITDKMREDFRRFSEKEKASRLLKTPGSQIPDDGSKTQEGSIEKLYDEATKSATVSEEADAYPEIDQKTLDEMQAPDVIWDEDFLKNLGIGNE